MVRWVIYKVVLQIEPAASKTSLGVKYPRRSSWGFVLGSTTLLLSLWLVQTLQTSAVAIQSADFRDLTHQNIYFGRKEDGSITTRALESAAGEPKTVQPIR